MDTLTVSLNNSVMLDLGAVQADVPEVSKIIDLAPFNNLTVSFSGALEDRLTVEILGHDATPPLLTVTPPTVTVDTEAITLQGTVDDSSAIVTVNDRVATVTADGRWTIDGFTLQQGENVLTIRATDSCGNSQDKQVTVSRR
jgi:hypothetical protein